MSPLHPFRVSLVAPFLLASLFVVAPYRASAAPEKVYVQLRSTKLRGEPKAWANGLATVSYGDALGLVEQKGDWLKVRSASGKVGFLHASAVTVRPVVLKGEAPVGTAADSSDVVLAGKGFNKSVEQEMKRADAALNYRVVDEMERVQIADAEISSFIKSGQHVR